MHHIIDSGHTSFLSHAAHVLFDLIGKYHAHHTHNFANIASKKRTYFHIWDQISIFSTLHTIMHQTAIMTAHTFQDSDIATRSNMVFDRLWLEPNSCTISPLTGGATASCTSCLISSPYTQQRVEEDCYTMPIAAPVSFCTSKESDASTAPTKSITGRFTDIKDKYYVDPHVLGTGIHGSVRKCINHTTGQQYAVKTIYKNDPEVKAGGLVHEIKLLEEMKHPNIVQLEDVYEDEEYLHLVTNLCEGGELFDKIIKKSSSNNDVPCFSEDKAAKVIYQLLTTISYMHKRNAAHRDIKPENILFDTNDKDSAIKIIDFGLARKYYGSSTKKV